jgi:hypothetical protein
MRVWVLRRETPIDEVVYIPAPLIGREKVMEEGRSPYHQGRMKDPT